MKKILSALFSAMFLAAILVGGVFAYVMYWYQAAGPQTSFDSLLIEPGTGSAKIAQQLEDAGWISNAMLFRIATKIDQSYTRFKAGEYEFSYGSSPQDISQMLVEGKSITHAITVAEGKSSAEIVAQLMADTRLTGLITQSIPEGSLLPDTHHVHRGDTRASVIERMRKAMQAVLPELWEARSDGLPLKTPEEAVTLASIVEKETGVDGEGRMVAGVFINRLKKGMKLQSDPTTVYAIERKSGPMKRPLYRKDWEYQDPYNTYFAAGLPPAPICHPGLAALRATLNPANHDYLYFVATGKGGHYFAKTLREHNRNIARYKKALRAQ